jgi:hypothetical protein
MTSLPQPAPVEVVEGLGPGAIPARVFDSPVPLLLKGLVSGWPAVAACSESLASAAKYLSGFWTDQPVTAYVTDAASGGRFFYNDDFTGFNFRSGTAHLGQVMQKLAEEERGAGTGLTIYVGSTNVDRWLPGFRAQNDIGLPFPDALASFWLGNRTRVSAHFDFPDNIACVVAGRRRFTLFPPEQVGNLYIGPVDRTPSGQAISVVDFSNPDLERYPRFADAMAAARVAEMGPGDALFVPSMWWHHVESFEPFNLMVNYWWCSTPPSMGAPTTALMHAMLSLRDLPPRQREAWRTLFNHYVFDADESVYTHIPEPGRGCLAPLDDAAARKLRAELLNRLNR